MDENEAWLASLAGRPASNGDVRSADEGRWMRDAMLRWAPDTGAVAEADPRRLAALLARARAEGLIPPVRDVRGSWLDRLREAWAPRSGFNRLAAAFSLAFVCVLGAVLWSSQRDPAIDETVRSAPDGVTLIRTRDPVALQKEIVDALATSGVSVTTYTRFGRLGIDADLPPALPAPLVDALARHRIAVPADRVLKVEIEAERR